MNEAGKILTTTDLHPVYTNENYDELAKQYEDLKKEMNQFTYIVSHDLQAPLRMVTGFLELLERKYGEKLDASAKQYVDYAVKGANKMKALVFDLLDYSRLSSVPLKLEEIDLNLLWQEILKQFEEDINGGRVLIECCELPVIMGDKKQVKQLFMELVLNAVKFSPEKPSLVRIHVNGTDAGQQVSITDNGIGIDPAYHEKVFIVFRRLHSDETRYPGTGIGLAMCKKIMELHQGRIEVSSEPGKGATFSVYFPTNEFKFRNL